MFTGKRLSLLATVVAVACLIRLAMTHRILGVGPVSLGLQLGAAAFMIWARITFGKRSFHAAADATRGELVTRGPYALVRNPIYLSIIVFTWVAVAVHPALETVLLGLGVTLCMVVRVFAEERYLRATYPEYADYERRVKRLVPLVF